MTDPSATAAPGAAVAPPPLRSLGPGLAGVFSLIAYLSLVFLPFVGVFLALLAPIPLVHLLAGGRPSLLGWGWVAVLLAGATLVLQAGWLAALTLGYVVLTVWPAVSVELWLRRSWTVGRWSAVTTLGALVMASAGAVAFFAPAAPADALTERLSAAVHESGGMASLLGAGGEEVLATALHTTAYLMPALAALYVLGVALFLRPRLSLLGIPRGGTAFRAYASEEWLPVGFVLGGLGWVFAAGMGKWLAGNLLATVLGLYFVHGLAIIFFYLGRWVGDNRWLRLAVLIFALQLPVTVVLSGLGIADSFFSLRRSEGAEGGKAS